MDVTFLKGGRIEFTISRDGLMMQFRIESPFRNGIEGWRQIRNGATNNNCNEGCKMSSTPSNITLVFHQSDRHNGTYQWIRLIDGVLELTIEIEKEGVCWCPASYPTQSIIRIPIQECYNAIDKLIDYYETIINKFSCKA